MVFNTSSAEILDRALNRSLYQAFFRQLTYAFIGLLAAFIVWRIGYEHLLKLSPVLLAIMTFFLLLVFVPKIGTMRNGAHRWIHFGNFSFQPSEFIKYLLLLTYIDWVSRQIKRITFKIFCKTIAVLMIPIFLVMIEPDNGTAAVMLLSLIPLFFVTKIHFRYWAMPLLLIMIVGGLIAYNLPYVRSRIQIYLHPELDLLGKGHQPHQSKIAAGSGKIFGKGPGGSLQKLTYLPEAQNDYIAAIYAEEFGFIGILILIVVYMLLGFAGFSISLNAKDPEGCYLAMAVTFLIAIQAFLNLGVVSGLLPSKGVNLPFFSQGGTSLIANFIGAALLLDIGGREENASQTDFI